MRLSTLSLALAGLLSLVSVPAHAFFEANVDAGYTTVAMGDLNDLITGSSDTKFKDGFYISADAGISLLPFLKISPRVAYIQATQAKIGTSTLDASLVPMELGLTADVGAPGTGISIRAGLWGGYGMGMLKTEGSSVSNNLYQGGAFTGEILGSARYKFLPFLSLNLEAGYRLAKIDKMQDGAGKSLNTGSKDIAVDFSGMNLGGGVTFSF